MAIWQVSFHLLNLKKGRKYSDIKIQDIEKVFPKEKSWCETIVQYGKLDSTCVEIGFDDKDTIEDISLRIDLRSITRHQLQIISDFANENDFLIEYQDITFYASIDNFIEVIRNSNAQQFLKNPIKYLRTQGDGSSVSDNSLKN